jgi:hypothetical protein
MNRVEALEESVEAAKAEEQRLIKTMDEQVELKCQVVREQFA